MTQLEKGNIEAKVDQRVQFSISQPSRSRSGPIGGTTMADHEGHTEGSGKNEVNDEQSTFGFPKVNSKKNVQMKNISPLALPNFHSRVHEDQDSFLFEFDILCWGYDYFFDAPKLKLFAATIKDSTLCWFMGLGGNIGSSWDQMKRVFLNKYQEYCKTREMQDEIFTIV